MWRSWKGGFSSKFVPEDALRIGSRELIRVALLGTCRMSSLGKRVKLEETTKSSLTGGGGGLGNVYSLGSTIFVCHPFNYTTKLQDAVDSLEYLNGTLDIGGKSANESRSMFNLYCRGYGDECFEKREMTEPGEGLDYDMYVIEVCSLRRIVIKTRRFGEEFYGKNLPWNIEIENCHQKISSAPEDFDVTDMSAIQVADAIERIRVLTRNRVAFIGPYLLPYIPSGRSKHGEDDGIPVEKINKRRSSVASLLKGGCEKNGVGYMDMTEDLRKCPELLRNQYHFSQEGEEVMLDKILKLVRKEYTV